MELGAGEIPAAGTAVTDSRPERFVSPGRNEQGFSLRELQVTKFWSENSLEDDVTQQNVSSPQEKRSPGVDFSKKCGFDMQKMRGSKREVCVVISGQHT